MAKCPVCQTENAADFGLVNCSSCGSPFFVEIDGSSSSAATPSAPAIPAEADGPPAPQFLENFDAPPELASAGGLEEIAPAAFEGVATPQPEKPPVEDLRSIADYGNSELSLAREGAYRFTLYINGIDTAEIKNEIRHNLSDSRFLWDIEALLATVKDGELIIGDVSAVKAALAIQRLKLLPVELKWEQHAIHQNH